MLSINVFITKIHAGIYYDAPPAHDSDDVINGAEKMTRVASRSVFQFANMLN